MTIKNLGQRLTLITSLFYNYASDNRFKIDDVISQVRTFPKLNIYVVLNI